MNAAPQLSAQQPLTWQLVQAVPGALVYSAPAVQPPEHAPHAARGWAPSGSPEQPAGAHPEGPDHGSALQFAGYIGRVGLLAAALGIGAAIARTPGIAWAEPTDTDSASSTSESESTAPAETPSTSTPSTSSSQRTTTTPSTSGTASAPASTSPPTAVSSTGGAQTSATASSAGQPSTTTGPAASTSTGSESSVSVTAPGSTSPPAVVRSSGGAQSSTPAAGTTATSDTAGQQPAAPAEQQPATAPEQSAAAPAPPVTTPEQTPTRLPAEPAAPATQAAQPDQQPAAASQAPASPQPPTRPHGHDSAPPASPGRSGDPDTAPAPQRGPTGPTRPVDQPPTSTAAGPATSASQPGGAASVSPPGPPPTLVAGDEQSTQAAPAGPGTLIPPPANVVTSLLGTLGLAPLGSTSAPTPVEPPTGWAVLDWARRQRHQSTGEQTTATDPKQMSLVEGGPEHTGGTAATDPAHDTLSYHVAGGPAHGTVTITPDGSYTYTPTSGRETTTPAASTDSFTVTVNDAHGTSTTVPVTVTTDPAASPPATRLILSPEGTADAVHVSVTPTSPDTEQAGHLVVHNPTYDTLAAPAAGVASTELAAAKRTTGIHPPTTAYNPAETHYDAESGTIIGNLHASDPNNDTLTFRASPTVNGGTVQVTGPNGQFTYTPSPVLAQTGGTDTFTITVSDLPLPARSPIVADIPGHITTVAVTVTVPNPNRPPVADPDEPFSIDPAQPSDEMSGLVRGHVNVTDPDHDLLTSTGSATTTKGEVVVNPDGTFAYTPTVDARHAAAADNATPAVTQDSFTVTTSDPHGASTTVPVSVAISPQNSTPTNVATQPTGVVGPNGEITGTATASDPDGDQLSWSGPTSSIKGGQVTITPTGGFSYTPTAAMRHAAAADDAVTTGAYQDSFTMTVDDGHGGTVSIPVNVAIDPTNIVPTGTWTTALNIDGTITVTVTTADADGDPVTVSAPTTSVKGGTITTNPDGSYTYTPDPAAAHTAAADNAPPEATQDSFTLTLDDAHGGSTTVPVPVAITPANQTPTATWTTVNNPDGTVTLTVTPADPDRDVVDVNAAPASVKGGTITTNPDGSYTYTPDPAAAHAAAALDAPPEARQDSFILTLDDTHGGSTDVTVPVAITPANQTPTATWTTVNNPDGTVTLTVTPADADGDPVTVSAPTTSVKGGTITTNPDGSYTYTPDPAAAHTAAALDAPPEARQDSFTLTLDDTHGGSTDVTVPVAITPSNTAPSAAPTFGDPTQAGVVSGSLNTMDLDDDSLTYAITGAASQGTVSINAGGTFNYIAADAARLRAGLTPTDETDGFTVTVSDGHGGITPVTVTDLPVAPAEFDVVGAAIPVGNDPGQMTFSPDGSRAYVTNGVNHTVSVIDTSSNTVMATISVGDIPRDLAASENRVYVANNGGTLSVIDATTNTLIATIAVGGNPSGVALNPAGTRAYVTNNTNWSVAVIDTTNNAVIARVGVNGPQGGAAVSPDGSRVYVTSPTNNVVNVIDTTSNKVINFIYGGGLANPQQVALSPDGTRAYVTNYNYTTATVSVIDTTTDKVIATIPAGTSPGNSVAVSPDNSVAYITNRSAGTVSVIDTATNTVIGEPISVGGINPVLFEVAVSPDGHNAYVTNARNGTVSVLSIVPSRPRATVGDPDPVAGLVTGKVFVTYTDNATMTYTGTTTTAKGSVTVDPDGSFTYTPTSEARHAASAEDATAADLQDSFTVTATNTHGGITTVPVTVVISPANDAPISTAPPTVGTPDAAGVVHGSLNVTDPEGDSLSYTGPGNVVINPDGTFSYTPADAARLRAGLTPEDETGSFTVTVSDGHGGIIPVAVTDLPPIPPAELKLVGDPIPTGEGAGTGIAISPDGDRAYITHYSWAGPMSVIDTTTNTVVATIPVNSPQDVAVSGTHAYVTTAAGTVSLIDTTTNAVVGTIQVGGTPVKVAISPNGERAYVTNNNATISVIDTTTNTVITQITSTSASGLAISPDGNRLYATTSGVYAMSVIDTATNTVIATVRMLPDANGVTPVPTGAAVSWDGTRVYVATQNNTVSVFDTTTNTFIDTDPHTPGTQYISLGQGPLPSRTEVAISPDGTIVYATNASNGTVSVIDTATNTVITTVEGLWMPNGLAVSPDGSFAYVINTDSDTPQNGTVSVISIIPSRPDLTVNTPDPTTGAVTGFVSATYATMTYTGTTTTAKGSVTVDPDGSFTYTPTSEARHAASAEDATAADLQDSFTVTATNTHGGITTVTVPVAITPANTGPTSTWTATTHPDGAVTVTVTTADADGDPVTVSAPTTSVKGGTITNNPDGSYTYAASAAMRHAAAADDAAATGADQDTFTVTAEDGHGGVATVAVSVAISPTNAAPTATWTTTANPDGTVIVSLNTDDADGDAVTVSAAPTSGKSGKLTPNPDGSFTYSPTQAAELRAGLNPRDSTDTLTVTLTDGHGGITPVTISDIPVSAIQPVAGPVIAVGRGPSTLAISGDRAYCTNNTDNTISVIDTTSNAIVATIAVGNGPHKIAAIDDRAYVTNYSDNTVSVIDTTANSVIDTVTVGNAPFGVAVGDTPNGRRVYVANYNDMTVSVIDAATNAVIATSVGTGPGPTGLAINPDGRHVYIANQNQFGWGTVSVMDTTANGIDPARIPIGDGAAPFDLTVSPDNTQVYVANRFSSVSVIDTTTRAVSTIPGVGGVRQIAMSPDGSVAYVADNVNMSIIDAATKTVLLTVPNVGGSGGVAVSADGNSIYVTHGNGTVSVVSLLTVQNLPPAAGDPAYSITSVHPDTGIVDGVLHVTDPNGDTLSYTSPVTSEHGGTATIDSQGIFTYAPADAARHAVAADTATEADRQDSFTVTITDGRGGATPVTVSMPITPANTAPVASVTVTAPDASSGVATGTLATDPDGDALIFTLIQVPAEGQVQTYPDGTFTYTTTTTQARQIDTDSFTVNVTDGHGGATVVSVNIPASAELTVETPITLGGGPYGVAVTPDGSRAYVVKSSGGVSVIDTATNTVIATIPVNGFGVAVSPDGIHAYVPNPYNNTVSMINTRTNTVVTTIMLPGARFPSVVTVSPDSRYLYITGSGTLSVFDTRTNMAGVSLVNTVDQGGIALSPDGKLLYVTSSGGVSVIDTATRAAVGNPIPVGSGPFTAAPFGLALSSDGKLLYVANDYSNTVSVIDTATRATVIEAIPVGGAPSGVTVSPDGSLLYVSNRFDGTVLVINTATNTVTATITVGEAPMGVAVSADGHLIYVANSGDSAVSVISIVPTGA